MHALTDFGDSAVLLPLSGLILAWLIITRSTAAAIGWLIACAICGGAMALLKILFFACPPAGDLESPSGHTALSVLVYGGLAVILLFQARAAAWRILVASMGAILAVAIGASRVFLHEHSTVEVILGFAVGGLALGVFIYANKRSPAQVGRSSLVVLLFGLTVVLVSFHGAHLRIEEYLQRLSARLGVGAVCHRAAQMPDSFR